MTEKNPEEKQDNLTENENSVSPKGSEQNEVELSHLLEYHQHLFNECKRKFEEILSLDAIFKDKEGNNLINKDVILQEIGDLEKFASEISSIEIDEIQNRISTNIEKTAGTGTRISAGRKDGVKKYQNPLIKRVEAQIIRQTEPIFSSLKNLNIDSMEISSDTLDSIKTYKKDLERFYLQYITFLDHTKNSVEFLHYKLHDFSKFFDDKLVNINLHLTTKSDLNKQKIKELFNEFKGTSNYFTKQLEKIFDLLNAKCDSIIQNLEDLDNRYKSTASLLDEITGEIWKHLNTKSDLLLQRIEKLENDFSGVKDHANKMYNEAARRSTELFQINDMRQESVELKQAEILKWFNHLEDSLKDHKKRLEKLARFSPEDAEKLKKLDEILHVQSFLKKKLEDIEKSGFDHLIPIMKNKFKELDFSKSKDSISPSTEDLDYFLFEERFRGKSEDIRKRQESYVEYFKSIDGTVVDMGCGKGEFLELLKENKISSYGIDSNPEMISHCRRKNLEATEADLIEHLSSLQKNTLGGLFSAQTIEHIPPGKIMEFVKLAFDKLKSGGILIIETLNPLSLYSLTNFYYKDLFHVQPIHPQTLSFLMEMAGFKKVEINFISQVDEKEMTPPIQDTYTYPDGVRENLELINQNFSKISNFLYGYQEYFGVGVK